MPAERVILITPGFTADEHDRNCLPTLQLFVLELLRQNVAVQIVALDYPFSTTPYHWQGAEVFPCGGRNSRWLKPRTIWRAIRICSRLLASGEPVAVHSFWLGWASGIGEYVAKRHGVRHITTLMGQDILPQNRHRFRFLTQERQQRMVVLSDIQNDLLMQYSGFRAAHVIPWGVDHTEIPVELTGSRPVDVLGVGSLIPLKNWTLWLETLSLVVQNRPETCAELIGSGPERARLIQQAAWLGLEKNVQFTEEMSRPLVLKKMRQAKLLLHTSTYESQGYVLSEAAMNGCRIVGTPVGIAPLMGACAATAAELALLVEHGLQAKGLSAPVTPFLMEDTVRDYIALW